MMVEASELSQWKVPPSSSETLRRLLWLQGRCAAVSDTTNLSTNFLGPHVRPTNRIVA